MELLNEPNQAITKNLFLSSLKKHKEPIKIKIVNVGSIFKSKMSNKPNLFIDILILNHFNCSMLKLDANNEPETKENNEPVIINENILNEIVSIPYNLTENKNNPNNYIVSNRSNLFNILNYCLQEKKLINANNNKGFNISEKEIKEALIDVVLYVKCELITNTNYKPYLKLIPAIKGV